ncbi:hypothetical protein MHK_003710 [Candidatus Magnetomorum sp. HK-1]|nr:hypothetical protein MHK_003710 [Candidatus Magnetomorum sp. HK-1]
MTPFQLLMKHRELILPIHQEQKSIPKTYKKLLEKLPEIKTIKFNTFKQYMPRLIEIADQLGQEIKTIESEKNKLKKSLQENALVIHDLKIQNEQLQPDENINFQPGKKIKVDGWNVVRGNDGYFRANRKIRGKVISVYLGKKFNESKAQEKIKIKMEKLVLK